MTDPYADSPEDATTLADDRQRHDPADIEITFDPLQMVGPDDVLTGVLPPADATGFQPGEDRIGTPAEMLAELRHLRAQVNGDPTDSALFVTDPDEIDGYDAYHVVNYAGDVVRTIVIKTGLDISDGHHTFDEVYEHRRALTAVLATIGAVNGDSWRSKLHHPEDGPMFDGSFIVGIDLPAGTITYHYPLSSWDEFSAVKVLEHAPKWDGAGPPETLVRLRNFTAHLEHAIAEGLEVQEAAEDAADDVVEASGEVSPCTATVAADEEQTGP